MRKLFIIYYTLVEFFFHIPRIKKYLKFNIFLKKPIIFDIGSHEGKMVKLFFEVYKNAKIHCFEPNKLLIKKLIKLKKKNLFINNNAVGKIEQIKKINFNEIDLTSTLAQVNQSSLYLNFKNFIIGKEKSVSKNFTRVITLDAYCKKKYISNIDLIKIDVEGYEYMVLLGSKNIIKKSKYIIIEIQKNNMYKNYSIKKIENFLKKNNFHLMKSFSFPFMFFQDRLYRNKNIN